MYVLAAYIGNVYLLFGGNSWLADIMQFVPLSSEHRLVIFLLAVIYFIMAFALNLSTKKYL